MFVSDDSNTIGEIVDENIKYYIHSKNVFIVEIDNRTFLVMKKDISNSFNNEIFMNYGIDNTNQAIEKMLLNRHSYGGVNSFIVDMQGIKNFINASFLDFKDLYIRAILKKIGVLQDNYYLRVGVAGAPNTGTHPGGEVIEEQLVYGKNGGGISNSFSGYLLNEEGYSKGIQLCRDGKMLENRMVYSHTAFLEESKNSRTIYHKVKVNGNLEFMEYVKSFAENIGFEAFAVQAFIEETEEDAIAIKGRVLKRRPQKAFEYLYEATEIGNEKEFKLNPGQQVMIVGTYFKRKDADWYDFTNGREYERKGHYHVHILNDCTEMQHEVFHLRELRVLKNTTIHLLITPIEHIVKITPLTESIGEYKCSVTGKSVETLIEEFM